MLPSQPAPFPLARPRRLRSSLWVRRLVAETTLTPADLIWPLFVTDGIGVEDPIATLPGVSRWSVDLIVERAADFGIPAHDIVVDPLVMPVGAMASAGQQVFALVRRLREELGVNTTCGASNISFGLPHRHGINGAFLPMAIGAGMTSAIMNPVRQQEM